MKKILAAFAVSLLIISSSCKTALPVATSAEVSSLANTGDFMFMAERANVTNYDVVNVMNSIPNSTGSRMLSLDYGYGVHLKSGELSVELPYFGRLYNPSYDSSKNGLRFTSKDFSVKKSESRKGGWNFEILPKDQANIRALNLEIYKDGRAFLSVDANDRQPISYTGYITKNEALK